VALLAGKRSARFFSHWEDSFGELSVAEMKAWLKNY